MVDMTVSIGGEMILLVDLRGCVGACVPRRIDWPFAGSNDGFGDGSGLCIRVACCDRRIQPFWLHEIDGRNPMVEAWGIWWRMKPIFAVVVGRGSLEDTCRFCSICQWIVSPVYSENQSLSETRAYSFQWLTYGSSLRGEAWRPC